MEGVSEKVSEYIKIEVPLRYQPESQVLYDWQKAWNVAGCVALYDKYTLQVIVPKKYCQQIKIEEM